MSLNKAPLADLPSEFQSYMGKAVEVILTGHFHSLTVDYGTIAIGKNGYDVSVPGIKATDILVANGGAMDFGLVLSMVWAPVDGTVRFVVENFTGGAVVWGTQPYTVVAIRSEKE